MGYIDGVPFSVGLALQNGLAVYVDDFVAAQAFEAEGQFALGGVGIDNHHVCYGCFMLRNAFEVAVFKDVVTDIDELATIVGGLPAIAEGTVCKWVPSVVRLWMIGHEDMVDDAGFVVDIGYTVGDLSIGMLLALFAVARCIENPVDA